MTNNSLATERDRELYRLNALDVVGSWSVHDDSEGHLFYYDHSTNESRWELPSELQGLESEFMMKLLIQGAIAKSGPWTAHEVGNGTLYYFNQKTRESVWERPSSWGAESAESQQTNTSNTTPKVKEKKERKPVQKKMEKNVITDQVEKKPTAEEVHVEEPLTEEEILLQQQREEDRNRKHTAFREMLRDKKIMPFCKWSVAFPSIAMDPRFLAVPSMDERRAIFEEFVSNRSKDLKNEKKQKLKVAKEALSTFLETQWKSRGSVGGYDTKKSWRVMKEKLEEEAGDAYERMQQDVLALLPTSVQEKIWKAFLTKIAPEREEEGELLEFLIDSLKAHNKYVSWEDVMVHSMVQLFYAGRTAPATLTEDLQKMVVMEVAKRLTHANESEPMMNSQQNTMCDVSNPVPHHIEKDISSTEQPAPEVVQQSQKHPVARSFRSNSRSASRARSRQSRINETPSDRRSRSRRSRRASSQSSESSRSRSCSRGRSRRRQYRNRRRSSSSYSSSSRSRSRSRSTSRSRRHR